MQKYKINCHVKKIHFDILLLLQLDFDNLDPGQTKFFYIQDSLCVKIAQVYT